MAMWKEQPNNYNDRKRQHLDQPTYSMKNRTPPVANGKDKIVIGNASDRLQERFKRLANGKDTTVFFIELLNVFENFEGK